MHILQARAVLLARIRAFFAAGAVLEVETPACSACATTDPAIESLRTNFLGPGYPQGLDLYLHTSPEFHMKRLLAAGSGSIYQICHVYRNGELGRLHHPEFSLLEWYRLDFDHHQLMDEVAALINAVANRVVDKLFPQQRFSYEELFQHYLQLNPHTSDQKTLQNKAIAMGFHAANALELPNRDAWLDLLLTHCIEPHLPSEQMTFVYDYPASQAALAQIRPGTPPLAERFELYLGGMELANGFHELRDAVEQQRLFAADLLLRNTKGQLPVPMDQYLISAMESGLPDCAGVAIGIDRLLMCLTGAKHIAQVLTFPL